MNARKAKCLRRGAEQLTVGQPARRLLAKQVRVQKGAQAYTESVAVNDSHTTRGVYLRLKKEARA